MKRTDMLVYLVLIFAIMAAGCAHKKQEIPADEIRGRADRAFDELQKEETGKGGSPEADRSSTRPLERPQQEQGGAVQVAKGATRPDWVDGQSVQYPSSQYLTGVGYDADRKTAEDKARAEIAKIFVAKLDARTKTY